jgi:hypothetical protein
MLLMLLLLLTMLTMLTSLVAARERKEGCDALRGVHQFATEFAGNLNRI